MQPLKIHKISIELCRKIFYKFKTLNKKKYDVIISLGRDCTISYYLRHFQLQKESLPFDWLIIHSLESILQLFQNDFDDFLSKENLSYELTWKEGLQYIDNKYKLSFRHDFIKDFHNEFEDVVFKYKRRISRMQNKLSNAKKVLFVHQTKNIEYDLPFLKRFINTLNELYEAEISLLYIVNDSEFTAKKPIRKFKNKYLEIIHYNLENTITNWKGNPEAMKKVLSKYELNS